VADEKYLRWEDRDGRTSRVLPPDSESLRDVAARVRPLWKQYIMRDVLDGKTVLVVAHGNTIRTLMQAIDGIPDEAASLLEVPQCIPLVYRFVLSDGKPMPEPCEGRKSAVDCAAIAQLGGVLDKEDADAMVSAEFLANEAELAVAQLRVRDASLARYGLAGGDESELLEALLCTGAALPGLERNVGADAADLEGAARALRMASLEEGEEEEGGWAGGADLYFNLKSWGGKAWSRSVQEREEEDPALGEPGAEGEGDSASDVQAEAEGGAEAGPTAVAPPSGEARRSYAVAAAVATARAAFRQRRQRIIIIRHGKTHHNKLGLFTGWEDAKLAPEGRAEAIAAGRMLSRHGVAVDVVRALHPRIHPPVRRR
jgi:2,3-bisphosphoglycerate-dependent phosphoglycerate mutase